MKKDSKPTSEFKYIDDYVTERGIKYTWLCDQIGVSTGYLSNIKFGRKSLTPEILGKINKALGTKFKI